MNKIWVESVTNYSNCRYSDEQYGEWEENHECSVKVHTRLPKHLSKHQYDEFVVNGSEYAYAVAITYTTGDSFGYSTGNQEIVWGFSDHGLARECAEAVRNFKRGTFNVTFKIEDGKGGTRDQRWHNPADGYFETLTDVDIVAG